MAWPRGWFGDIPAELAGSSRLTRKQRQETRSAPDARGLSINVEMLGGSMIVPYHVRAGESHREDYPRLFLSHSVDAPA
jgi:hypothetical protein